MPQSFRLTPVFPPYELSRQGPAHSSNEQNLILTRTVLSSRSVWFQSPSSLQLTRTCIALCSIGLSFLVCETLSLDPECSIRVVGICLIRSGEGYASPV